MQVKYTLVKTEGMHIDGLYLSERYWIVMHTHKAMTTVGMYKHKWLAKLAFILYSRGILST